MLIIPTGFRHEFKREIVRLKSKLGFFHFITLITLLGSVCTILGISLKYVIKKDIHPTLYVLVLISLLYTVHYCRAYYREKRKRSSADSTLRGIHAIAHSLREIMLKTSLFHESISNKECYIQTFKSECQNIAERLYDILCSLGYNVGHVCIKSYDPQTTGTELSVVSRSDKNRKKINLDEGESEDDNPFFKLLFENHFSDHLYNCPVLKKIKQNKWNKESRIKYLGLGNLSRVKFPESVYLLLKEYGEETGRAVEERDADELLKSIRLRSEKSKGCESQLGILISNNNPSTQGRPCAGFIGVDSGSSCAWDFINEDHLNVVAAVADLLYEPMLAYNKLRKDLLSKDDT